MSEGLIIMLEYRYHLYHASRIHSSLVVEWNINACDKSYSNWNSFLRDNSSFLNTTSARLSLNDFII
jgi:hypothetical protein